ncbi:hypothetical protein EV426DRAFT_47307 [Tirmania nivea]|nr:hypothetical protein EV426DRAFT_47307 [Tirmania nivea]
MQFSTATVAAVAAFLPALVSAHISMINPPTRFKEITTNLSPLDPSGHNYPCYVLTGSEGELPVYAPGSQQEIGLQGSAVHGGGSCQISITYDNPPNKNSVFKVIKSFEGGCPGSQDTYQNLPANPENILPPLPYTIPTDIPSGVAVVAWSWFNKIGNREMYMRCAPIKISGSNSDTSAYNSLPDMFKANIGNGCSTTEGSNVIFPNPGSVLDGKGTGPPVGNCGSTVSPSAVESSKAPVLVVVPTATTTLVAKPTPTYVKTTTSDCTTPTPIPTPILTPVSIPKQQPTSGSCVDGAIICTSQTTWSMCDHGKPTPMGLVAPGTNCKDGKMVLATRSVRFSHDHVRRRHGSTF